LTTAGLPCGAGRHIGEDEPKLYPLWSELLRLKEHAGENIST